MVSNKMIHATAIVDPQAKLGNGVIIGPFCHVGPHVTLEDNVHLVSHVSLANHVHVGEGTKIFPFSAIGQDPQHRSFHGEPSWVKIGPRCLIREHVTIHPGTEKGGMETVIGHDCMIMVAAHVAHDCTVGNHVLLTNNATLGGHVHVGDYANVGGMVGVHQFVRIGQGAIIGGMSGIENDVIPYGSVIGNRARLCGLNLVGLKRRGLPRETIHDMRSAYRLLFANEGTQAERVQDVAEMFAHNAYVMEIIQFMQADTNRALCLPER
jgi:UDP-N-acetylglucosamine acyltransferase